MATTPYDEGYRAYPHRPRTGNPYRDFYLKRGNHHLHELACYKAWFEGYDQAKKDSGELTAEVTKLLSGLE